MMALNGMYVANVSNFVLNAFAKKLSMFMGVFATNVSDQLPQGSAVEVPYVSAEGAAVDLADVSDDRTNASVSPEFSTTKKTITLAHKPCRGFYVSPWEAAKAQQGILVKSLEMKINNVVGAVALAVVQGVIDLVTAANFVNSISVNPAAFDKDSVSGIRTVADGLEWADEDGVLVLNSALHESLREDGGIIDKSASGANTLNTGILPNLHGFGIMKNRRIPTLGSTAADENLVGLAALPSAIGIAMRPLSATEAFGMTPAEMGLSAEEALFDEEANVACTLSIWGAPNTKVMYHTVETWWGAAVMEGNALIRLKTA